ncbi:MAG: DUF4097 domain-containing protein [Ruminococcaceae bacterium]|nr:DUF4097 domain-containing protein [Oscillospiraceae bacterium]
MKKSKIVWIIIAVSLIVLGALISTVSLAEMSFDFNNLNTQKYISNEHIFAEDFTNIKIDVDTSNIEFVRSENNDCMIVSIDTEKTRHIITVENGTLMISLEDSRKWYDYIGVFTMSPSLTIHLPKDSYDLLNIEASTSDIVIQKDFTFGNVDIETDTGDIQLLSQVFDTLDITTDTGDVKIQDITAQNITLETDTGETYLTNVNCNSLVSNGNTGDIKLTDVIAAKDFNIKRSTGDIRFVACDAGEIFITTDTGDVSGTLLTDKVFICKTDTGDIDVPKTTNGGKCEITTDTGDIEIIKIETVK